MVPWHGFENGPTIYDVLTINGLAQCMVDQTRAAANNRMLPAQKSSSLAINRLVCCRATVTNISTILPHRLSVFCEESLASF